MSIVLLTLEYPPHKGGVATYLAGEVSASREPVEVIDARRHFWDKWPAWLPLLWRISPSFSRKGSGGGYDYLWISHILPVGYVALWWKFRFRTPYRVYVHGLDLVRPSHSAWKRLWASLILKNADEIIANSNATRGLLARYGIDSRAARVSYPNIPHIDPGAYLPKAAELRQKYALGNRPVLLTVSRLVRRKGIDVVLRSLLAVWKQMPELVYVVVGDGEARNELTVIANEVKQSRNNRSILFTGEVDDEEKYAWLAAADCFILTPIDDPNDFEGYGIVYKEAQMFGKPVIGSRVGGVPEAIGGNGALVDAGSLEQIAQAILNNFPSLPRRG
ncbi:MAG: glycosyltransferase family 4 protein [Patescibacteria group bacterium]